MAKTNPITFRLDPKTLKDLERIVKVNNTNRTNEIERFLEEGIKRSKKNLKLKSIYYMIMMLTISLFGLQVWLSFI